MAKVAWSEEALSTLASIIHYIEQFDPAAAERVHARLIRAAHNLADFPNRGRPAGDKFRELTNVPPYVIRYVVTGNLVTIARIRHGRQRPSV